MRKLPVFNILLVLLAASIPAGSHKVTPIPPEFLAPYFPEQKVVIAPGDVLTIRFYFHPELNQKVVVRSDGKIALEFFQGLQVTGLTPEELQQQLVEHYAKEFKEPVISVDIEQRSRNMIYVTGEVMMPGAKPLTNDLTVGMVLALCQTNQKSGAMKSVILIRKGTGQEFVVYKLDASLENGLERDVYLRPGDILFVPRKTIVKIGDFVQQYIRDLFPPMMNAGITALYSFGNNASLIVPK